MENFTCEAKGYADIICEGKNCIAHIITRKFKTISASINNRIHVCKNHEIYFNTTGKNEWALFIKTNFPEKYNFVLSKFELVLNDYKEFINLPFPFVPEIPSKIEKRKQKKTPITTKVNIAGNTKNGLCVCPCHTQWETPQAYCWDCHNNHSAAKENTRFMLAEEWVKGKFK